MPTPAPTPDFDFSANLARTLQNLATIRDPNTRALLAAAAKDKGSIDWPVLSHDGKTLICAGCNGLTYIYRGGTYIYRMKGNKAEKVPYRAWKHNDSARLSDDNYIESLGAAFSPNERLLAAPQWAAVSLFDARTFRLVRTFAAQSNSISSLAFSHDGKRLLAGNAGGGAAIYDVASGKVLKQWHYNNYFKSLLVSFAQTPDGEKAVALTLPNDFYGNTPQEEAAVGEAPQLWDVEEDMLLADFPHSKHVEHAAFSSDGLKIAIMGDPFEDDHVHIPSSKLLIVDWNSNSQPDKETVVEGLLVWTHILWTPDDKDVVYVGPGLGYAFFYVVPASP